MFPDTYLPLNIFETRYLKMVDNAISNKNRLIGMIQPKKLK
jgi:Lon protease-like protein